MILNKKLSAATIAALTVVSIFTGVSGASAATVKPQGVTVSAYTSPTSPQEPSCKKFLGTFWNTDCTGRDRYRKAKAQSVTTKNVEKLFLATYVPLFSVKPGKKQSASQINIQNAFTASYERLMNNSSSSNLKAYKNLALYQLSLNATKDNALSAFTDYNNVIAATGYLGKKAAAKTVVKKVVDYAAKHVGLKTSVNWVAVTGLTMSTVRSSGICAELTMVGF